MPTLERSVLADPKILVVEDDPIVLMSSAHVLREAGFDVVEATTVDDAVKVIADHGRDVAVVFTDIETPGQLNGIDLAHAVRAAHEATPVVLTSGRVAPVLSALPADTHFVCKPYNADQVAALIVGLVKTRNDPS